MRDLPFPAIVDQRDLKTALLLNAVNRSLGGVLIRGEKGTGKSTTVRSLKRLLPEVPAVAGCVFNCHPDDPHRQCAECRAADDPEVERIRTPVVELPLGATEDRVVGSLDIERALNEGVNALEPGLLARANRGVLYIDEANLLDDHLIDVLLDAAASGENRVEREGVSAVHPADFILVGTMNPDEGELRPQLLDRFGLQVEVTSPSDPEKRVAIMEIAERFDRDPDAVIDRYADEEAEIRATIEAARARYDDVELPAEFERAISELCVEAGVEGNRGDIVTARCARALAALDGRDEVTEADLRTAVRLALPHRVGGGPLGGGVDLDRLADERFGGVEGEDGDDGDDEGTDGTPRDQGPAGDRARMRRGGSRNRRGESNPAVADALEGVRDFLFGTGEDEPDDEDDGEGETEADKRPGNGSTADDGRSPLDPIGPGEAVGEAYDAPAPDAFDPLEVGFLADYGDTGATRPGRERPVGRAGRYVKARSAAEDGGEIAIDASLRSAARRGTTEVERGDVHTKVRERDEPSLVVFAVDSSASMRAHGHIETAKGLMTALFRDVYRNRDAVSVVAFRDETAELFVPPTPDARRAARRLDDLPTGNRTPLAHGLYTSMRLIEEERALDPDLASVLIVMTDGRPTVAVDDDPVEEALRIARRLADDDVRLVVLDVDAGVTGSDVCRELAEAAGGEHLSLAGLSEAARRERVTETVRSIR